MKAKNVKHHERHRIYVPYGILIHNQIINFAVLAIITLAPSKRFLHNTARYWTLSFSILTTLRS
jgi:hypothetical protein